MKKLAILILFLDLCFIVSAQKEANNWVFGENAGVSWNTGVPVAFTGSPINQDEGVSAISNTEGELLFYSDGVKVWNRLHQQMPNGFGLIGNNSSTQSGLIVPWPGDTAKYFLFTTGLQAGNYGYSIVDMSFQGGLGDVVAASKNTLLFAPSCEKSTGTRHANGTDVWVVSHQWGTNAFYSYLVTHSGIDTTPVISTVGIPHSGVVQNTYGYMKISPDATKLALAVWNASFIDVFDFNNLTGVVSNNFLHDTNYLGGSKGAYGIEFSPSGRFLYVSQASPSPSSVYQYDLLAPNIISSRVAIHTLPYVGGSIQLAPDNKLYIAYEGSDHLDVIHTPEQSGALCNYQADAVYLLGGLCHLGLPNFISRAPMRDSTTTANVSCNNLCNGDATVFPRYGIPPYRYLWQPRGDTTATILNLCAGTYHVTITDAAGSTLSDTLVIEQPPPNNDSVSITASQILFCPSDSVFICAISNLNIYYWSNGQTTQCIWAKQPGAYSVTVMNNDNGCMVVSNQIAVSIYGISVFITAAGDTLVATPSPSYQWFLNGSPITGATNSIYIATQGGSYTVMVTDSNGCAATSSPVLVSGIENISEGDVVSVYPNPTQNNWQLTVGNNLLGGIAEVFDANGRVVFQSEIRSPQSGIAPDVARGVYLLRISSAKSSVVRKLVRM